MILLQLVVTFLKLGALTFGGGMVIVALFGQGVVNTFGWLDHCGFLDAIALGQVTPGPVAISSVFVGCQVASLLGALRAIVSVILPPF